MKSVIYNTGLTPPPPIQYGQFKILYTPTITVEFIHHHIPRDLVECLKSTVAIIIISKNADSGLKNWLKKYNLSIEIFGDAQFWIVGEKPIRNYWMNYILNLGILN